MVYDVEFIYDGWDIRTERVTADDEKAAKEKIKLLYGRGATSLKVFPCAQ